jgi:hypothetical protein
MSPKNRKSLEAHRPALVIQLDLFGGQSRYHLSPSLYCLDLELEA